MSTREDNLGTVDDARVKSRDRLIIIFLMAVVFCLSVFYFIHQSLRLDEAQSLWQSSHNYSGIFQVIAEDVHVPLYHLLLHTWQFFLGNGVATSRFLSLIFFLLIIPAMYMLGTLVYNRAIALFATVLVAISPFLNWYGNETRMYTMFAILVILHQYFFIKIYRTDTDSAWWGFALTAILCMFTHYFFFFAYATEALFFLIYRRSFPVYSFRRFMAVSIAIAVLFAPWAYYVYHLGLIGNSTPILAIPTTIDLFNSFSQFFFGFQDDHINTILVSLWPLTILMGCLALRENHRLSSLSIFFLMMLIVPVALAFVVSVFVKPLFVTRYLILSVPALYLFLGWILSTYPPRLGAISRTVVVGGMLMMLSIQALSADIPVKENYAYVTQYLQAGVHPEDVIIVSAPFTIYPIEYYYNGTTEIQTLPIWNHYQVGAIPLFNATDLPAQVEQLKGQHQIAWLVLSYDQGYEKKIKDYFDNHFQRLAAQNFSKDLNVYVYKLRYDDVSSELIGKRFPKGD